MMNNSTFSEIGFEAIVVFTEPYDLSKIVDRLTQFGYVYDSSEGRIHRFLEDSILTFERGELRIKSWGSREDLKRILEQVIKDFKEVGLESEKEPTISRGLEKIVSFSLKDFQLFISEKMNKILKRGVLRNRTETEILEEDQRVKIMIENLQDWDLENPNLKSRTRLIVWAPLEYVEEMMHKIVEAL